MSIIMEGAALGKRPRVEMEEPSPMTGHSDDGEPRCKSQCLPPLPELHEFTFCRPMAAMSSRIVDVGCLDESLNSAGPDSPSSSVSDEDRIDCSSELSLVDLIDMQRELDAMLAERACTEPVDDGFTFPQSVQAAANCCFQPPCCTASVAVAAPA